MPSSRSASWLKFAVLLGLVAAAIYVFGFTSAREAVSLANLRQTISSLDPLVARLVYVLLYVVGTVLLLPGTLLSFVGAVLFGIWEGTLYTWIGATLGATLCFLVAKALGRGLVDNLLRGKLQALDRRLTEHGFMGLLLIRLVPLFPFNGVNFGSGLTGIRLRDYVLATAIGILPGTFVFQFLFASLGEKVLTEGFTLADLLDPVLGLALAVFAVFIVAGTWLGRRLANADRQAASSAATPPTCASGDRTNPGSR